MTFTKKYVSTKLILLFFGLLVTCTLQSQSLSMLKNVNVNDLTDAQISAIQQKMQSEGVNMDQLDQYAASQGISKDKVDQLKARLVTFNQVPITAKTGNPNVMSDASLTANKVKPTIIGVPLQIFGASVFKNANLSFEPNLRLATPQDYVLGPDDQILIDIYGVSEVSYKLYVSPEGTILIPNVGSVNVNGLTIADAKKLIKAKLSTIYRGITTGNTFANISLGNIRSITVFIVGEITSPGSYTIPSLATVYNALYQSGGPKESGSFRNIELIRENKVIATVDLYDFLVYGKQANLRLQDQDVIKVLPYKNRVTLNGDVKNPAIFEMKEGETIKNLIEFAGGFTENAYRQSITAYRNTLKEKQVIDIDNKDFDTFQTEPGDAYTVGKLLDRFENRVQISGAVYRPGVYALTDDMKIKDLIMKADGLREDAFVNQAVIFRKNNMRLPEMASFCPRKVLNDSDNILLQRDDSVYIASILTMKEENSVYISGEVISPNVYPFADGMTLKDLLVLANGFNHKANLAEVEVYRQITDITTLNENVIKAKTFKIRMDQNMDLNDAEAFNLKREDHVMVRAIYGAEDLKQVTIQGEVINPGNYILTSRSQHISDLLKDAGGLTAYAYPSGAMLIRNSNTSESKKLLKDVTEMAIIKQQNEMADSTNAKVPQALLQEPDMVAIDLHKIMMHPGSPNDLVLEEGDVLSIPKTPETVTISGEVLMPAIIRYQKGKSLQYYIKHSGGFSSNALKRQTYVIYPNGSMDATSSFLGIKAYPDVTAGSRIVVPAKPIKQGLNTAESITITSTLVSLMIVLLTFFKK